MQKNRFFNEINLSIIIGFLLLATGLFIAQNYNFDLAIQNYFFQPKNNSWIIDKDEPIKKFIFYKLPKILLGIAIVILLIILIFNIKNRSKIKYYNKIFLTFLGLTLIPLCAGNIKKFTNVYCPNQLEIYGGKYPYVKILDHYPADFKQEKKGKCFPAGHSITGFSLMILFFVFNKFLYRFLALTFAITLGWILGLYQMAKGVHFFSDTMISMICCFIIAALIARCFYSKKME